MNQPFTMHVKTVEVHYNGPTDLQSSRLDTPENAAAHVKAWNENTSNPPDAESFSVFGLDSRHRLTSAETLTRGTRNQAPVDAQRLFRHLLAVDAVGFIISHNHPSGDLEPSRDDIVLTENLIKGGKFIGIDCLDHIITAPDGRWISLRECRPDIFGRII